MSNFYAMRLRTENLINPIGIDEPTPRFSWEICAEEGDQFQTAYQLRIFDENGEKFWDSGKINGTTQVGVEYAGEPLTPDTRYSWEVCIWDKNGICGGFSERAFWQTGMMNDNLPGEWISPTSSSECEWHETAPYLRRNFTVNGEILYATVYLYTSGWYHLYCNGAAASDWQLTPALNAERMKYIYDAIDVTELIHIGENVIGLWIGDGYNENAQYGNYKYTDPKKAIVCLSIHYADGSSQQLLSDNTWIYTDKTPVVKNHIYNGEVYDARLESNDWCGLNADTSNWHPVRLVDGLSKGLSARSFPSVKVMEEISTKAVYNPDPGVYVFDMGQNFAGWVRLKVRGNAGDEVTMRFSEEMDYETHRLDPWTNRFAESTDRYILKGEGEEVYEPLFTYHGFRFVEITGYPGTPTAESIVGCVIYTDDHANSKFTCSNALLNQIHHNALWSMKCNLMSYPSDTPSRDERTPCGMDSQVSEEAVITNFNNCAYYENWLSWVSGDIGRPDWEGEQINLAWLLYKYYGDIRVLERHYPAYRRFAASCVERYPDYIVPDGFGDWCAPNPDNHYEHSYSCSSEVNTALMYRQFIMLSEIAETLGHISDSQYYAGIAERVKEAYNQTYYDEEKKCYCDGKQTPNILAIAYGLAESKNITDIAKALADNICNKKGGHTDTGIFGTRSVFHILADTGNIEIAMNALLKKTFPSFGFQIEQGATTIWEQWSNGIPRGGMVSHSHAMFAGMDTFFYHKLAGLESVSCAYEKFVIKPIIPKELSFVSCVQETVRGKFKISWNKKNDILEMKLEIPAGCSGTVEVPCSTDGKVIFEGNAAIKECLSEETYGYRCFAVTNGELSISSFLD